MGCRKRQRRVRGYRTGIGLYLASPVVLYRYFMLSSYKENGNLYVVSDNEFRYDEVQVFNKTFDKRR